MRTAVVFDEDTARALTRLRKETGMGVSQAVNHLVRRGLQATEQPPFVQRTHPLGLRVDATGVADTIEHIETPDLPPREPGAWKGRIWIAPDFDDTDHEIIEAFEGGNPDDPLLSA